jgi:Group II intron, maturase-specific domain
VILCRGNPQPWFQRVEKIVHGLGLSLNVEKTRIGDATDGFDFLGMHFRLKRNRSNPKRLYRHRWPATRAMQSVRQKVRDAVGYDDIYSLADKIPAINPILRGWDQYFVSPHRQRPPALQEGGLLCLHQVGELPAAEAQAPGQAIPSIPPVLLQEGRAVSVARHDCAAAPNATW